MFIFNIMLDFFFSKVLILLNFIHDIVNLFTFIFMEISWLFSFLQLGFVASIFSIVVYIVITIIILLLFSSSIIIVITIYTTILRKLYYLREILLFLLRIVTTAYRVWFGQTIFFSKKIADKYDLSLFFQFFEFYWVAKVYNFSFKFALNFKKIGLYENDPTLSRNYGYNYLCRWFYSYFLQQVCYYIVYYYIWIINYIKYQLYRLLGPYYSIYYVLLYKFILSMKTFFSQLVSIVIWEIIVRFRRERLYFLQTEALGLFLRYGIRKNYLDGDTVLALPPLSDFILFMFDWLRSGDFHDKKIFKMVKKNISVKLHLLNLINIFSAIIIFIIYLTLKIIDFFLFNQLFLNVIFFYFLSNYYLLKKNLLLFLITWDQHSIWMIIKKIVYLSSSFIFIIFNCIFFIFSKIFKYFWNIIKKIQFVSYIFAIYSKNIIEFSGTFFIYSIYAILTFFLSSIWYLLKLSYYLIVTILSIRLLLLCIGLILIFGWGNFFILMFTWIKFVCISIFAMFDLVGIFEHPIFTIELNGLIDDIVNIKQKIRDIIKHTGWYVHVPKVGTPFVGTTQAHLFARRKLVWSEHWEMGYRYILGDLLIDPFSWFKMYTQYWSAVIKFEYAKVYVNILVYSNIFFKIPWFYLDFLIAIPIYIFSDLLFNLFQFYFYITLPSFLSISFYNFLAYLWGGLQAIVLLILQFIKLVIISSYNLIWSFIKNYIIYNFLYVWNSVNLGCIDIINTNIIAPFFKELEIIKSNERYQLIKMIKHSIYNDSYERSFFILKKSTVVWFDLLSSYNFKLMSIMQYAPLTDGKIVIDVFLQKCPYFLKYFVDFDYIIPISQSCKNANVFLFLHSQMGGFLYKLWYVLHYFTDNVYYKLQLDPFVNNYYSVSINRTRNYYDINYVIVRRMGNGRPFWYYNNTDGFTYLKGIITTKTYLARIKKNMLMLSVAFAKRVDFLFITRIIHPKRFYFNPGRNLQGKTQLFANIAPNTLIQLMWHSLIFWVIYICLLLLFSKFFRSIFDYKMIDLTNIEYRWQLFRASSITDNLWLFDFNNTSNNSFAIELKRLVKSGLINLNEIGVKDEKSKKKPLASVMSMTENIEEKNKDINVAKLKGYFKEPGYNYFFETIRDEFMTFNLFLAYAFSRNKYIYSIVGDLEEEYHGDMITSTSVEVVKATKRVKVAIDSLYKIDRDFFNFNLPYACFHKCPGFDLNYILSRSSKQKEEGSHLNIYPEDPYIYSNLMVWIYGPLCIMFLYMWRLNGWVAQTTMNEWMWLNSILILKYVPIINFFLNELLLAQLDHILWQNRYRSIGRLYPKWKFGDISLRLEKIFYLGPIISARKHEFRAGYIGLYSFKLIYLYLDTPHLNDFEVISLIITFLFCILGFIGWLMSIVAIRRKPLTRFYKFSYENFGYLRLFFKYRILLKKILLKDGINGKI